jgi:hypothetical protein
MSKNIYTVDNSDLDGSSVIVPKDTEDGQDSFDSRSTKQKHEVLVKVVNNTDQNFDATPAFSSSDDEEFTEYDTADDETATVSTGSVPDNVESFRFHGVRLNNFAGDPTSGEVKITINSKVYAD